MSDSNSLSSSNWYYAQDGNSIGPVPFATLQALRAIGQITGETHVIEEGGEQWKEYGSLTFPGAQPPIVPTESPPSPSNEVETKAKKEKENKQAVEGCLGCLALIVAIVVVTGVFGKCSSSKEDGESNASKVESPSSNNYVTDIANAPLEYKLTYLDGKRLPRWNDINATRIRHLLKKAAEKTGQSEKSIADTASRAQQTLRNEYGRDVTILDFMEGVDKLISAPGVNNVKYEDAAILMVTGLAN